MSLGSAWPQALLSSILPLLPSCPSCLHCPTIVLWALFLLQSSTTSPSRSAISGKRSWRSTATASCTQFLALIRLRDGTPLCDAHGRVTSHLSGLFFRTTRLIAEHGLRLVFVFDGAPPPRKAATLEKRREVERQFEREHAEALARGDLAAAYSKATMTSRLTREMVGEARELLRLLGLPTVQAPAEGEAQAAHMAHTPDVWAAASKDYDTLMFGAPRLVRFLTISGKEFLPSAGTFRPIVPEIIELPQQLDAWQITRTARRPRDPDRDRLQRGCEHRTEESRCASCRRMDASKTCRPTSATQSATRRRCATSISTPPLPTTTRCSSVNRMSTA